MNYLLPNTAVAFTAAASSKIATYSLGNYSLTETIGYPNLPNSRGVLFSGSGANTTAAFTTATDVVLTAGDHGLSYSIGTGPVVISRQNYQGAAGALNATGTLTAALILGGIVTSSTAAAVTATLDTGTVMDAVNLLNIGDSFDWSAINTGGTNAFTVTASSGHTIVGSGVVALTSSAKFRTVKTAAATYVTYRI